MSEKKQEVLAYRSRRYLLSKNELAFFHVLTIAVRGGYYVFAKVRLADVVTVSADLWDKTPGRRISQKHLDFVLCERHSTRIIAAIELDDRSHAKPDRRRRDAFLNQVLLAARIPLFRQRAQSSYTPEQICLFLKHHMSRPQRGLR